MSKGGFSRSIGGGYGSQAINATSVNLSQSKSYGVTAKPGTEMKGAAAGRVDPEPSGSASKPAARPTK